MAKCPFKRTRKQSEKIVFPPNSYNLLSKEGLEQFLGCFGYTPENTIIVSGYSKDGSDGKVIFGGKK